MPDASGKFRGISVPRVPWKEDDAPDSVEIDYEPFLAFVRREMKAAQEDYLNSAIVKGRYGT